MQKSDDGRRDLEQALVGALLITPDDLWTHAASIDPSFFLNSQCREIVMALCELAVDGSDMTMANVAAKSGILESTLVEMSNRSSYGEVSILARALAEYNITDQYEALRRQRPGDAFEALALIEATHKAMQGIIEASNTKQKADYLRDFKQYCEDGQLDTTLRRIPTPFPTLTSWCRGGWPLGNITFIGGAPGSGKTSFALACAIHAAKKGIKTIFIQAEMPMNEILERAQGMEQDIDVDDIARGREMVKTAEFIENFQRLPIDVQDTFERTAAQLNSKCSEAIASGVKLIVVDYLQIFTDKSDPKKEFAQIKAISENCRKSALKRDVHYLILSSLNRIEAMAKKVTLHSFYGGSQLGHDCSIGIILFSAGDDEIRKSKSRILHCDVVKNRGGYMGEFEIIYHLQSQRMEEGVGMGIGPPLERYEQKEGDLF